MTTDEAVEAVWSDITARSGGDAFLETIDAETQAEIRDSWREIIWQAQRDAILTAG